MRTKWEHWETLTQLLSTELENAKSKYVAEHKSAKVEDWIDFVQYHNGIRVRKATLAFIMPNLNTKIDLVGRKWNGEKQKFVATEFWEGDVTRYSENELDKLAKEIVSVVRDIEPNS